MVITDDKFKFEGLTHETLESLTLRLEEYREEQEITVGRITVPNVRILRLKNRLSPGYSRIDYSPAFELPPRLERIAITPSYVMSTKRTFFSRLPKTAYYMKLSYPVGARFEQPFTYGAQKSSYSYFSEILAYMIRHVTQIREIEVGFPAVKTSDGTAGIVKAMELRIKELKDGLENVSNHDKKTIMLTFRDHIPSVKMII